MSLQNISKDAKEILAANGDYSSLSDQAIYVPSIEIDRNNVYFILKNGSDKQLAVYETKGHAITDFDSTELEDFDNKTALVGKLNEQNSSALAKRFVWMKPVSRHGYKYTFGLGDRLGYASNAHLRLLKGRGIFPVLAQQSIRELVLTGRTFTDVIQSAEWAVFEEGYKDGWGADGDHVKNAHEVDYAIKTGCTMITLDATETIHNEVAKLSDEELDTKYNSLDNEFTDRFNKTYLNKTFDLGNGSSVSFTKKDLEQSVLIFFDAVEFATNIYHQFVVPFNLDFEISMDETIVPTSPANHYFFANELHRNGITPETIAPRFYGEFQKAIDYIGDLGRFELEYAIHEAIAEKFGYRLSIHSGSDKLSVYEIIGRISKAHGWHVKIAGTNWLEALKVVGKVDPQFLADIYKFAYENLNDVKDFYVFNAQTDGKAPKPENVNVDNVTNVLKDDDGRQVLHTMYGSILNLKHSFKYVYRDKFFKILKENQSVYDKFLNIHLAEHVDLLQGLAKSKDEVLKKYEPQAELSGGK